MTNIEFLKRFNKELGGGDVWSMSTPIEYVPVCKSNPSAFKSNIMTVFRLNVQVEQIPLSSFKTVGDLIYWVMQMKKDFDVRYSRGHITAGKEQLNIIITGKSGAGKSSFLNYLIDNDYFKTGDGAPVTSQYFEDYLYESPDTGVTYRLLDTKGIEPDSTKECEQKVINEIQKSNRYNDIFKWIHTVYYCFDASAKRIQPYEIGFIKNLKRESDVVILLTKKDLVTEDILNGLIEQIKKDVGTSVQIISVCSVEKHTRKSISVRSGREEVLKASFLGLWNKTSQIYPEKLIDSLTVPASTRMLNLSGVINTCNIYKEYKSKGTLSVYHEDIENIKNISDNYFEAKLDRAKRLATDKLSINYLRNYPMLPELFSSYLSVDNRKDICQLMDVTNSFINDLKVLLTSMNVDLIWTISEKMNEQVFNFYKKLNRERPHILYSHHSKDRLNDLKNYDINKRIEGLIDASRLVKNNFKDIESCFFFESDEKRSAIIAYNAYSDKVKQIGDELSGLIGKFVDSYKSELYQYGQYCIRKDKENIKQVFVCSEEDLDATEKLYYDVLLDCLVDSSINCNERAVLDKLRLRTGISTIRAGLIEDYIRNQKMCITEKY